MIYHAYHGPYDLCLRQVAACYREINRVHQSTTQYDVLALSRPQAMSVLVLLLGE
jgi:hypothetical protein